ncbi:MAG TPA: 4-coumarate--CoA ligase family protein [Pyrinomonadaceae bacterium]|nr:4-coumarate--CoA ligase family protein [Pyrinomonadaceae bacterium]
MIFRSPHPDVEIPEIPLTDYVFENVEQFGDKPALIEGLTGRTLSYAQLHDSIRRVAAGLARRGLKKGEVLAILSPNVPEYIVCFHAVASLGAVSTTVNPLYTVEEVGKQLRDARARFLVTVPQLLEKAQAAAEGTGVEEVFVFGEAEGATPFSALLEGGEAALPEVEWKTREDLVALPYSSGTTGVCKGVMLTHHNLVANLAQIKGSGHDWSGDNLICVLPLFHIYGLVAIANHGLRCGSTIVTLPRFDFEQVLRFMQDYRVSVAHIVPPVVLAMAKHPSVESFDLSALRMIFSGAAPLSESLARACAERLGCEVVQGYGMTETSPATHLASPSTNKHGSVGVCVPNMECKVVDLETGAALGTNEEGEICVRGPQVMLGYLGRPDATAQTIDAEGWLHTGDIGYADEEGFFFIVDRAKELIKYKGFQVAPAELEAVLLTHPSVADAAVIPVADDEAGEIPKAFVVTRADVSAEEVIAYVAARVAPHKKIRRVEFIEQIPKSPSGKILRRLLVEKERAGTK